MPLTRGPTGKIDDDDDNDDDRWGKMKYNSLFSHLFPPDVVARK